MTWTLTFVTQRRTTCISRCSAYGPSNEESYNIMLRNTMGPQIAFCDNLHATKYREKGETFRDAMNRVSHAMVDRDSSVHFHAFREILLNMRFSPAGRVQNAMGASRETTPYNCYVSGTIPDSFVSRENEEGSSIMHRAEQAATTMRMGGGIGYDFSTLRPRGSMIRKLGSNATGPASFMHIFDAVGLATASSGHRRGAQMGVLRVDHPDIMEFVNMKHSERVLEGFNISVGVTDMFMEAVARDGKFDLEFEGEIHKTVMARELWETIMRSTWDWADPGVLFIDTINNMNNLWYCETIAATNPCVIGETTILTRAGWERIDSLINTTLDVWNGEEWSSVTPGITGTDSPLVCVRTSDGEELTCTRYHKFVLSDGSRVEAQHLQSEDKLLRCSYPVIEGGDNDKWAYQQGFYQGDGWCDARGRTYIGLFGEKKSLISEFSYLTAHDYQCSGYEGTDTTQTSTRLYFGQSMFRDKGFVPDTKWSLFSRLEWIAGLSDSDGTVSSDGAIQISSKDRDFCVRVVRLLSTLGVKSSVGPMKDCWRLGIRASCLHDLMAIGFRTRRLPLPETGRHIRSCQPYVRIVSVEDAGIAKTVYCFSEPKRHTAVFDGVLSGQCGEQPLPPFGACLLGSFNLTKYIAVQERAAGAVRYSFDFDQLAEDVPHVVRAMDNVCDRARYPLSEQQNEAVSKRRMGLGVMGLANAGETLGHPYGSPEFLKFHRRVHRLILRESYRASARLAAEKGSFPLYDQKRYMQSSFVATLDPETRALMRKHGMRNSHLTSDAPTGTISMCADNISSGIEPVFSVETMRAVNMPDGPVIVNLQDYAFANFGTIPRMTSEVTAAEHVAVLCDAAKLVDSAVSKTCNVDGRMPWEDFKNIYMSAYEGGAKGCTTFNIDGKKMALLKAGAGGGTTCEINPETGARSCE
jgi:ribonucleoside-diphosphate reductase alpha chain